MQDIFTLCVFILFFVRFEFLSAQLLGKEMLLDLGSDCFSSWSLHTSYSGILQLTFVFVQKSNISNIN